MPANRPVNGEEDEAPTAKRSIPAELLDDDGPESGALGHVTMKLRAADIEALLSTEQGEGTDLPLDQRETLPAPSSSPGEER